MFNDRYGLTQAVLEGRKTMTRRMIKVPMRFNGHNTNGFIVWRDIATHEVTGVYARGHDGGSIEDAEILPSYKIGEVVAIAQSYRDCGGSMEDGTPRWDFIAKTVGAKEEGWHNKMFVRADLMPHRIRITDVRAERLQDISEEDCIKEGIIDGLREYPITHSGFWFHGDRFDYGSPRSAFASLIDKVSGRGTWESNPWVFVYEFELIR